ncbi:MAG: PAS domain S-box protein [Anaerolineae bacterium]|nr:PAS domain S-box protein [Anaerolineae bacterium]
MQQLFRGFNDWPLGVKLVGAFVLLSVAAIAATTLISVLVAVNQLDSQLRTSLTEIAASDGEIAGSLLSEQITLIEASLSIDPDIISAVQLANEGYLEDEQDVQAQLLALDEQWVNAPPEGSIFLSRILDNKVAEHLHDYQAQVPEQVEVFATDRYGALVAASNRTSDYYQADEEWWQRGWNSGQGAVVITEPELDASTDTMSLSLIVPIIDSQSEEVIGLIKAVYDLRHIQNRLTDITLGQTGHLNLLTSAGIVVVGQEENIGQPSEEHLLQGGVIFSGRGFVPSVQSVDGNAYVMAYVPMTSGGRSPEIDNLGWVTLVLQERSEAYASVEQTRLIGVLGGIMAALVGSLLVFVLSRILVTRQVSEIQRVFRTAAVGNFDARARIFTGDEIGRTAEGVNAMLAQLSSLIESSEAERSGFMESFAGAVALADMEENITYLNLAGAQMLGHEDPSEIAGVKRIPDFLLPEDYQAMVEVGIPTALEKESWTGESRLLRADGSIVPVEQIIFPIRDEQGRPRNLGVLMTDITERKQAEANLTEALAAAKMTYVRADILEQVLHFDENFYSIFGELPGQENRNAMAIETFAQHHVHPDSMQDFEAFQQGFAVAIETEDPDYTSQTVLRIVRANGEEGIVIGNARNLKDAAGITLSFALTFQDITEARVAEAQLAAQNEALGNALEELRKLITNVDFAARQLASASESIVEVLSLLSGQAMTSAELAEQAASTAQEGDQAVNDTISAMGRIRESAQETTRRIKRLGEASQEIGEVVRLIDEIADRVTVLALNASIQAAAAGEAGRGFAVVAEEVQRLAERATNATRQIENMVKSIQGEINEAMVGVEETTHEVVGGSQLAQSAGERIADLNRAIGELSGLVQHVADTTSQQTTESLAVLAALAADLQSSVAALDVPAETSAMSDNGGGRVSVPTLAQE